MQLISQGKLKPGDRLLSERVLSKNVGVGRLSLREALRVLESLGVVRTEYGPRRGTYVAQIDIDELAEKLSYMLQFTNISIDQLIEARLELSLVNLNYFMKRATDTEIKEMEKCLKKASEMWKLGLQTRDHNILFHQLIARGTRNPILIVFHDALIQVLRRFLAEFVNPKSYSKRIIDSNREILKYIKAGKREEALACMEKHITLTGTQVKKILRKMKLNESEERRSAISNES